MLLTKNFHLEGSCQASGHDASAGSTSADVSACMCVSTFVHGCVYSSICLGEIRVCILYAACTHQYPFNVNDFSELGQSAGHRWTQHGCPCEAQWSGGVRLGQGDRGNCAQVMTDGHGYVLSWLWRRLCVSDANMWSPGLNTKLLGNPF